MKKLLVLLVPVLATVALALVPAASTADTFWKCPKGVTDHHYCTKHKKCKVPNLKGKTVKQARVLLRQHDCQLGKVHHKPIHKKHKNHNQGKHDNKGKHHQQSGTPGRIYHQAPRAGTIHKKGKRVAVWVYGGTKHNGHRHKHH